MNTLVRSCLLVAAVLSAPALAQEKAKTPAAKAPAAAAAPKPLLDNEKVRAYESVARPGVEDPMRERPGRVVRALNDSAMQRTTPDGKAENVQWKTGEVRWYPREKLAIRNTGKQDAVFYIVELK